KWQWTERRALTAEAISGQAVRADRGDKAGTRHSVWREGNISAKDKLKLTSGGRFKTVEDGDAYRLTIYDLTLEDSGQFMCRAKNSVGEESRSSVSSSTSPSSKANVADGLSSLRLPKGVFTRTCTVTEGKHAKLSCFVTGHPKPHIIWRKDGSNINEGRRQVIYEDQAENFILKILYCKQSDNGLYTCNATNMAGQTYSAVLVTVKARNNKNRMYKIEKQRIGRLIYK
uniref:Ig-like domain-containing protein n=1 Tax=Cyclopterus lumpus TaxID=8103 RepID=A0A8C3B2T9_CYCLU